MDEVWELYAALIMPAPYGYAGYEKLRARLIAELGYDAFRERQKRAFALITEVWG